MNSKGSLTRYLCRHFNECIVGYVPFNMDLGSKTDVLEMVSERPRYIQKAMEAALGMLRENKIGLPKPLEIHDSSQLKEALHHLQDGEGIGKSVVELNANDIVTVGRVFPFFCC